MKDILALRKMGDVIAYNMDGNVQYAMFTLDEDLQIVLWDMSSQQQISLKDIQSEVIGFYQYDSEEDNFDLYLGIGNSPGAKETAGSTLEFNNFPTGWGSGADSHIRFSQRGAFECDGVCTALGIYSTGQLLWEVTDAENRLVEVKKNLGIISARRASPRIPPEPRSRR